MRYALRTLPTHPSRMPGDIIPIGWGVDTPEQADRIREGFTSRDHLEVVALDENGDPMTCRCPCRCRVTPGSLGNVESWRCHPHGEAPCECGLDDGDEWQVVT